jgi:arylsulfatase A-like enzyme
MKWMKKSSDENAPFFCYLATNLPHFPNWVDTVYSNPYRESGAADFYGMIANLDENMGNLVNFLDDTQLRDNTILIFLTDYGSLSKNFRKSLYFGLISG